MFVPLGVREIVPSCCEGNATCIAESVNATPEIGCVAAQNFVFTPNTSNTTSTHFRFQNEKKGNERGGSMAYLGTRVALSTEHVPRLRPSSCSFLAIFCLNRN